MQDETFTSHANEMKKSIVEILKIVDQPWLADVINNPVSDMFYMSIEKACATIDIEIS